MICLLLSVQILEEVERRREISPALVYPFMRSVMEAPFPAPGRTVTVKSFLPGSGNEVTLKPKEEMLISSSVPPDSSFLQSWSDSDCEVIRVNNTESCFNLGEFTFGRLYILKQSTMISEVSQISGERTPPLTGTLTNSLLSGVSALNPFTNISVNLLTVC